ncbi:hypothetical protein NHQ30_003665 [Ciborinia camelliae]|nr:hypothetical protein NHQ30_003665 [Ciborinia camelliae]
MLTFRIAPLIRELASDETAELFFAHGPVDAYPPKGYEDYFGPAPHHRFIKAGNTEEGGDDLLERIRNFPKGATTEDQMRELMRNRSGSIPVPNADGSYGDESAQDAMEYLYDIMQEEGPFDGIMGYSEGAAVAGTLLLHEQKRFETEGRPPMFKCAVFFAGWPPLTPEFNGVVLADETDLTITVPTLHISKSSHFGSEWHHRHYLTLKLVGSLDPYLAGCISLYNVCDMDNAYLFDHGKGHTLPRDSQTVRELCNVIRTMRANIGIS